MGVILLQLSDRVSDWWHSLPERTRSVLSLVIFIGLIAAPVPSRARRRAACTTRRNDED